MPDDEPWVEDIERFYKGPDGDAVFHGFTPEDEQRLEDANFGLDRLRDAFEEGFVDENVDTDDRVAARNAFLSWMGYLGYDPSDFDWDEWRNWKYGKE